MRSYGRVQPGDAVRYRLPDQTWLYGLVESIRAENGAASGQGRAAVAQVAFPITDQSLEPVRADCDPHVLVPLADPELRAFLAANTGQQWSRPQYAAAIGKTLTALRAAPEARKAS